MAITTVEKIESQINELAEAERNELLRRLNKPMRKNREHEKPPANGKKGYVSPDTIWLRDHSHRYPGQYVAIKNGKFIASGRTIKEADLAAKALGVKDPLLHYVLAEGEVAYCGIIQQLRP